MLTLTIFLSSCSSTPDVIKYDAEPIDRPKLVLPETEQVLLKKVDWDIITKDNIDALWKRLEESGEPVVIYVLDTEGYEALSLNMADLVKLISQEKARSRAFQEYYEENEETLDAYESEKKEIEVENYGLLDSVTDIFK